jgi:hypothetical protein
MFLVGLKYRISTLFVVFLFPVLLLAQGSQHAGNGNNNVLFPGNSETPRFTVSKLTNLCLGAFYPGNSGGNIEISDEGVRSSNGSVILLHSELTPSPAVFEIRCPNNTMVNIFIDEEIKLRNQAGNTIICEPQDNGQANFISPHNAQSGFLYRVGAALSVQNASSEPSGEYSGKFNVVIVLE